MTYEIGNPSDQCFVEADDKMIAAACILFLGNGQYFCTEFPSGTSIPGTFFAMGGSPEVTWEREFGIGFEEFISRIGTRVKMKACFASFRYKTERSSMNNIGLRAQKFAATIETDPC